MNCFQRLRSSRIVAVGAYEAHTDASEEKCVDVEEEEAKTMNEMKWNFTTGRHAQNEFLSSLHL